MIKQSKDWNEFLKKMAELGYELKYGKHIAFKPKGKARFTRDSIYPLKESLIMQI